MANETVEWLLWGLSAATAFSVVLAAMSLLWAVRAKRRLTNFERSLTNLEQAMQSAATIFAESDSRMNAACAQISQLAIRQGTLDASKAQAGFKQAIALSRRGASDAELIETCGVSEGEARLIQTMYGAPSGPPN